MMNKRTKPSSSSDEDSGAQVTPSGATAFIRTQTLVLEGLAEETTGKQESDHLLPSAVSKPNRVSPQIGSPMSFHPN